jgi:hypothetical protein
MTAKYFNVYDFVNCSNYGIVKTKHTGWFNHIFY